MGGLFGGGGDSSPAPAPAPERRDESVAAGDRDARRRAAARPGRRGQLLGSTGGNVQGPGGKTLLGE